jgi:hypothetical protein
MINNPFTGWVPVVIGLALVAAAAFGGYYLFLQVYDLFRGLDSALMAILLVALISALIIGNGLHHIGQMQSVNRLRLEKKAELYGRIITACFRLLKTGSEANRRAAAELEAAGQQLVLWGRVSVLKQFTVMQSFDPQSAEFEEELENLLRAMRRDLGQSNLGLYQGDLFELLPGEEIPRSTRHN